MFQKAKRFIAHFLVRFTMPPVQHVPDAIREFNELSH